MRNKKNGKFYSANKPNLYTPDFPVKQVEQTVHKIQQKPGITSESAFSKIRNYDARLNTIDINIVGAANIFGIPNPTEMTKLLDDSVGLFTGSLNDLYFSDDFLLLATVRRHVLLNYWGMNIKPYSDRILLNKAFFTWESNVTFLETKIKEAMYTDLAIFTWTFQDYNDNNTTLSQYDKVMTPLSYALYCYQMNIYSLMITILNFEYLVAQLPKLQELYKGRTDYFVALQQQLKRSAFTAPIRELMQWIKKRFVDQEFMRDHILPTAVVSKETDGLNSPIVYLLQTLRMPLQPIRRGTDNTTSVIPITIFSDRFTVNRDASTQAITGVNGVEHGILELVYNAFNIDTILNIILDSNDQPNQNNAFQTWLRTAHQLITTLTAQTLDLSRQSWFVDLEAALSKLASQPGSLNWKQNTNFTSLPPVIKYTNYQLVNDLVTFACSRPRYHSYQHDGHPVYDDTGYRLLIPMFRRKGLPPQLIKEMTQIYYLPSDEVFMSYLSLGSQVQFRTRDNVVVNAKVEYRNVPQYQVELPFFVLDQPFTSQAYLALQDYFTFVIDSTGRTWINSELMCFINASFQNRWADVTLDATRKFIIPQA